MDFSFHCVCRENASTRLAYAQTRGTFPLIDVGRAHLNVGSSTPSRDPECYKKAGWTTHEEKASKQHSSVALPACLPPCFCPAWVPAWFLSRMEHDRRILSWENLFLSKFLLVMFYDSNRKKQILSVGWGTILRFLCSVLLYKLLYIWIWNGLSLKFPCSDYMEHLKLCGWFLK